MDTDYSDSTIEVINPTDYDEVLTCAKELYASAKEQLDIESKPQWNYSISSDNPYFDEVIAPILEQAELGDFLFLELDNIQKTKQRIIRESYELIDTNDTSYTIEFSSMTNCYGSADDYRFLLDSTKSSNKNSINRSETEYIQQIANSAASNLLAQYIGGGGGSGGTGSGSGGSGGGGAGLININGLSNAQILQLADKLSGLVEGTLDLDTLDVRYATIEQLEAEQIRTNTLEAKLGTFEKVVTDELEAKSADIGNLNADIANIHQIMAGNVGTGTVQTINITGENAVFEDAVIKDAAIDKISANKLSAGVIDTNEITISSNDGGIKIEGNTQQWTDADGTVRMQAGQDAEGNFSLVITGDQGTTLIDETGIHEDAVPDELIVNRMVSDNAAIDAHKLEVETLFQVINEDNTYTLNASKIWMDTENQTLGAKFTSISEEIEAVNKTAESASTQANANQEKLTTLESDFEVSNGKLEANISETTILKQNLTSVEEKADNAQSDADSALTQITDLETSFTVETGQIKTSISKMTTRIETAQKTADDAQSDADSALERLDTADTNILSVETKLNETISTVDGNKTEISSLKSTQSSMESRITTIEENAEGLTVTVSQNLTEAKEYAEQQASSALTDSKSYTDTQDQETLSESKSYTDKQDEETLSESKSYTDSETEAAVTESKNYTDAQLKVQADRISMIVSDSSSTGSLVLTSDALDAIARDINLTGKVTFTDLDTALQGNVNTGLQAADTVDSWCSPGTTTINGGMITTGTIKASSLMIDDVITSINGANTKIDAGSVTINGEGLVSKFSSIDTAIADTIKSVEVQYAQNASNTTAPTSGWSTTAPAWQNGKYMWQRTVTTYMDGSTSISSVTCITGATGQTGEKGADGTNAIQYYTWVKYADSPTSGMSDSPDGKEYIGIAYNKTSSTPSTTYSDYAWSLIKGTNGTNGSTYYTWIKYADSASGSGMSDSPDGKSYIGIAYNKTSEIESTNASDYEWSLFKGSDGANGSNGDDGRGVESITSEYYLSSSRSELLDGEWSEVSPEYISGFFVWTRSRIVYTNPTETVYTDPQCDTSWEAIGNAQHTADEATSLATSTDSRVTLHESEIKQLSDSISMLVTDGSGASLMTQTENGWTFSIGGVLSNIEQNNESLNNLSGSVQNLGSSVDGLQSDVSELNKLNNYINIGEDENGQPCIELGQRENDFKLKITNTQIQFWEGSNIPAYMNNQKLYIEQAEVLNELQFGNFIWKIRSSGNMGLLWKG